MIHLYDLNKKKIRGLIKYKDLHVESSLVNGDKKLSFLYPDRLCKEVKVEGYIRTKTDEFVIKEINPMGEYNSIVCNLNLDELEGKAWEKFESVEQDILKCLNFAIVSTGWTCEIYGTHTKKRTIRKTNCSAYELIQQARKTYRVEIRFNTLEKKIEVYEALGSDKGVYFTEELNMRYITPQSNSYDFFTRIIAIGKSTVDEEGNDTTIKATIENHQYSSKVKTFIWKDERYSNLEALTEDATYKLNEISKPYEAIEVAVVDLAKINSKYSILAYELGDTVRLISKSKEINQKQRIIFTDEYLDEPHRNTVQIANSILTFEDIQKEYEETVNTVNNITSDNGTISDTAIKDIIASGPIDKEIIQRIEAVEIITGSLEATYAKITDLDVINGNIENLTAEVAKIGTLEAEVAKIGILEVDVGYIKDLVNGNLTSDNIHSLILTSAKVTVENGFIKNAMIESLDVSKINAGTISTNSFTIASDDGGIKIVGATQQFSDSTGNVRLQLGQDAQGAFNFILRGEDGTSVLIDHTGIKENAITDDLIKENMIAENAVGGKQIDYSSFATGFNDATNTNFIKATHILLDNQNQSLEIAFNQMSSSVNTAVESVDVFYYLSDSPITQVGGEWTTIAPDWKEGKYMWSKTVTTLKNGTVLSSEPICITGASGSTGEPGRGIQSIVEQYYLSTSQLQLAGGVWQNEVPKWLPGYYIWTRSVITYTDNTSITTNALCSTGATGDKGDKGDTGADGVAGNDGTPIVWKGTFASHPSNPQNGWAYYNSTDKRSYVYQSGQWYQMTIDGTNGQDGNDGFSVVWKGELQNPPANPQKNWCYKDTDNGIIYIWTGTAWEVMVLDGNDGHDGAPGNDGMSVFITYNDSITQPAKPTGAGTTGGWHTNATSGAVWMSQKVSDSASTGTWGEVIKIKGFDGSNGTSITSVDVMYYLSLSETELIGGTWVTEPPAWQNGKFIWSKTKTTLSSGATTETKPVCITGGKGSDGSPGSDGRGIIAITEEYAISESKITAPTTGWRTTPYTWSKGNYIWTRSKITYKNPDGTLADEYTTPVCDSSWEAVNDLEEIVTSNTTTLNVQQGQISALISNTTITKENGVVVQMKDEYMTTVATVNSINSTIGSHTTSINKLTGEVEAVNTKTNEMQRTLDETVLKVSSLQTQLASDVIRNGDFSKGLEFWRSSQGLGTVIDVNGVNYYRSRAGQTIYLEQVLQNLDAIKNDQKFILSFKLKHTDTKLWTFNITSLIFGVTSSGTETVINYNISSSTNKKKVNVAVNETIDVEVEPLVKTASEIDLTQFESYYLRILVVAMYLPTNMFIDMANVKFIKPANFATVESVAEIKLQANQISQTVTENKIDADGKISSAQSSITQLSNQIASKVDVNGVKSVIEQNPNSVKIGFNGINNTFEVTPDWVYSRTFTGKKSIGFRRGNMHLFNTTTEVEVGKIGINTWSGYPNVYGLHIGQKESSYLAFSIYNPVSSVYNPWLYFNFGSILDKEIGIHQCKTLHGNGYQYIGAKIIDATFEFKNRSHTIYDSTNHINILTTANGISQVVLGTMNGSLATKRFAVDSSLTHSYQALDMHNYVIMNTAIHNAYSIETENLEIIEPSLFKTGETIKRKVTKTINDNTEWIGSGQVVNGQAEIMLPDVRHISYSVFLSTLGRNTIYLIEKLEDRFIVESDADIEFEFLVKFIIPNTNLYTRNIRGEEPPTFEIPKNVEPKPIIINIDNN